MTCCHRIFSEKTKEKKVGNKKKGRRKKKSDSIYGQYTWVQIEITKIFFKKPYKLINIYM